MFFRLKSFILKRSISKRNKKTVFDIDKAEHFSISKNDSPLINNSYYFSAHENNFSIFCRLGIRSNEVETWLVILINEDRYELKQELFSSIESSPLKVYLDDKKNEWNISFNGTLVKNNKEEVKVGFISTFHQESKYLDFSKDMPSIRMAKAIAQEKWSKEFFSNLENISSQTHYEQVGTLAGLVNIEGKDHYFAKVPCVRDHSFGKRDWDYMNNHLWLMAVSSELKQFNYSLVSYPVVTALEVGNFFDKEKMRYMKRAKFDLDILKKGKNLSSIKLKVYLDNHTSLDVVAKVLDTTVYHFKNNKYTLIENVASYEINGEKYKGILEVGFNSDKARIFNNKDTKKIKR